MTERKDLGLPGSMASANAQRHTPSVWQPIDSAPKDRTTVLICRYMDPFGWIMGHAQYHNIERIGGAWIARGFGLFGELGLADPTHWMPLPQPPGVDGGDSGDARELTTPANPKERTVSIETLEQLIARWREKADDLERMHLHPQAKLTRVIVLTTWKPSPDRRRRSER